MIHIYSRFHRVAFKKREKGKILHSSQFMGCVNRRWYFCRFNSRPPKDNLSESAPTPIPSGLVPVQEEITCKLVPIHLLLRANVTRYSSPGVSSTKITSFRIAQK